MRSGSQLLSMIATTGMPSLRASRMAMSSLLVSITTSRSGTPPMSRMPPSASSSLLRRRTSWSNSFLVRPADSSASVASRSASVLIEPDIAFQFVSIPPSQRWLT